MSVARVYADVNQQRPPAYWDYEKMEIEWRYDTMKRRERGAMRADLTAALHLP